MLSKNGWSVLFIILGLLLSTGALLAQGGPPGGGGGGGGNRIQKFDDATLGFAYIPGQDIEIDGSIDFTLKAATDQDFFLVIDYGSNAGTCGGTSDARCAVNPNNPADAVRYYLWNSDDMVVWNLADAEAAGDSTHVISGTVPGNPTGNNFANFSAPISIFIENGQLTDPNPDYSDTLQMDLYFGSIEDPTSYTSGNPEGSATLTVSGNVDPFVEVALVETGGSYPTGFAGDTRSTAETMDFGVLQPTDTRAYDLLARSNALFTISASSQNGGVLTYQGTAAANGLPTEVGYTFTIDGQSLDLTNSPATLGSGLFGLRWPMVVTISEYGVPVAGDYQDIIDITVTADQ